MTFRIILQVQDKDWSIEGLKLYNMVELEPFMCSTLILASENDLWAGVRTALSTMLPADEFGYLDKERGGELSDLKSEPNHKADLGVGF